MGKIASRRKDRLDNFRSKKRDISRRSHNIPQPARFSKQKAQAKQEGEQTHNAADYQQRVSKKVPFQKGDHVLLVGEGDFSFALSLAHTYAVQKIVATSYDTEGSLREKYSQSEGILARLQPKKTDHDGDNEEFQGFSPSSSQYSRSQTSLSPSSPSQVSDQLKCPRIAVYHGIDATKLSSTHKKIMRRYGPFSKIVFNFPHVGGLSTDVNRQTRANQKLIQGFFSAAKQFLVGPETPSRHTSRRDGDMTEDAEDEYSSEHDSPPPAPANGQIIVSLFTGEAYTDWNIRDIARDQGLRVVESFRFPWSAYPGYRHARTIGEVKTGKDRSGEGKRKGAWRGEEREARCFVFEVKQDEDRNGGQVVGGKRKKRNEDSESD